MDRGTVAAERDEPRRLMTYGSKQWGPVTPKAVRWNQLYYDNGITYDSELLSRYNRLGRAGSSAWELSDEYESEVPDVAEHEVAGGSSDQAAIAHQVPVATGERFGSFSVTKARFSRSELNEEVWVSSNQRGYASHRKGCGIKVSEKRAITLETALEWGKKPCQQCFNDYVPRLAVLQRLCAKTCVRLNPVSTAILTNHVQAF